MCTKEGGQEEDPENNQGTTANGVAIQDSGEKDWIRTDPAVLAILGVLPGATWYYVD